MGTLATDYPGAVESVKRSLDELVASNYLPGYVVAIGHGGVTQNLIGGFADLATKTPMAADTQFRIASLSKPWAAVLTLRLVEQGALELGSPITEWLPEFAEARVLSDPTELVSSGQQPQTVPAEPITVEHLLTQTSGYGLIFSEPGQAARQVAEEQERQGLVPWKADPELTGDDVAARFAALPLCFQPGTGWLYHSSTDLLSVLLERVAGPLDGQLAGLCQRLGLLSTGFVADPERLATSYRADGNGGFTVTDSAVGPFTHPPKFASLAGGMVSTAEDYLGFLDCLAGNGSPLLSEKSTEQIRSDRLAPLPAQVAEQATSFLEPDCSYGYQVQVQTQASGQGAIGRFGWSGGTGTTGFADPDNDLTAVLLTQRELGGPQDGKAFDALWQGLYESSAD